MYKDKVDTYICMHISLTSSPATSLEVHFVQLFPTMAPSSIPMLKIVPIENACVLCERKRRLHQESIQSASMHVFCNKLETYIYICVHAA
jgi:hypothetical protein